MLCIVFVQVETQLITSFYTYIHLQINISDYHSQTISEFYLKWLLVGIVIPLH